ncbi:MAG: 23S rRNA (adenine(2503)-C(2))-methyltransferase RlmN [Candidatus Latescibacter sp.]|nr:23S rRNA (adenine(2503)-C(2))-methyltransferase RlmN [Candidatus Latescibacter sp.]
MARIQLTGLLPEEISVLLPKGKEKYRGLQIFRWIHEKGARSFDEMTNLSKAFREEIKDRFIIGTMKLAETKRSLDSSTDKYLWELADGNHIESVIIRDEGRVTACISSQVGCKMGCGFCRTGKMQFMRNLAAGEIVDQLISMRRMLQACREDITNVVFMGMGEPLDNLDAVLRALTIIIMETGLSIGQQKITLSTCGIVPGIIRLAREYRRLGLAISLNAADDELRNKLMPINRRYPLKELLDAAQEFTRITRRRITFEYILMDGVNDSPEDARRLLAIARRIPSKINIIGYNEYEGSPFKRPSDRKIEAFQKILFDGNVTALLRKSRGTDILAACGQLAAKND